MALNAIVFLFCSISCFWAKAETALKDKLSLALYIVIPNYECIYSLGPAVVIIFVEYLSMVYLLRYMVFHV